MQYVHSGVWMLECFPINTLQRHHLNSLNGAALTEEFTVILRVCVRVYVPVCAYIMCMCIYMCACTV